MTPYETICRDLSSEDENHLELSAPPYTNEMDAYGKFSLTYRCLLRAQRLKQRKRSLTYAFYLGKLIETNEISTKEAKKLISDHYYQTSIRTYYIFETNSGLIESSQETTLTIICRLTSNEYRSLTLEI